jgi:uracil-DNA glycosylase
MTSDEALAQIDRDLVVCRLCPRLVEWREKVAREKRRAFASEEYWGRPVPNFGDHGADRLILGLAPAAHGANRTGRMFTGDRSGDWLYRALHRAGVANQASSVHATDGLELLGVLITAPVHCAPPENKPLPSEFANCRQYLLRTLAARPWKAILCLGSIAWQSALTALEDPRRPKFGHGEVYRTAAGPVLVGSYHPSQQNTFTGRLTEPMLDDAVALFLKVE